MPDKLTDAEVKKALECCVGDNDGKNCFDCPLWEIDDCQEQLLLDALDLINRLQAENERLKSDVSVSRDAYMSMKDRYEYEKEKVEKAKQKCIDIGKALKNAKTEAYKEFAERLKTEFSQYQREYRNVLNDEGACAMIIAKKGVDNLLKELVADE